jgi:hypothetical protein
VNADWYQTPEIARGISARTSPIRVTIPKAFTIKEINLANLMKDRHGVQNET